MKKYTLAQSIQEKKYHIAWERGWTEKGKPEPNIVKEERSSEWRKGLKGFQERGRDVNSETKRAEYLWRVKLKAGETISINRSERLGTDELHTCGSDFEIKSSLYRWWMGLGFRDRFVRLDRVIRGWSRLGMGMIFSYRADCRVIPFAQSFPLAWSLAWFIAFRLLWLGLFSQVLSQLTTIESWSDGTTNPKKRS